MGISSARIGRTSIRSGHNPRTVRWSCQRRRQQANISLHKTDAVAEEAVKLYRASRIAPKKVKRFGTAVVAYTAKPTAQQERTIEACAQKG